MVAPLLIPIALKIAELAAPRLIGALTGSERAAELAERVVNFAQGITGAADPDAALAKLRADPNLVAQLNVRLQEIEADLDKAYLADRQNARARDIEMIRAGIRNTRANWMVVLDVVGLIACLAVLIILRNDLEGEVITLITTVATYFGLSLRDAHQFEFGSSRGSEQKNELLARKTGQS